MKDCHRSLIPEKIGAITRASETSVTKNDLVDVKDSSLHLPYTHSEIIRERLPLALTHVGRPLFAASASFGLELLFSDIV